MWWELHLAFHDNAAHGIDRAISVVASLGNAGSGCAGGGQCGVLGVEMARTTGSCQCGRSIGTSHGRHFGGGARAGRRCRFSGSRRGASVEPLQPGRCRGWRCAPGCGADCCRWQTGQALPCGCGCGRTVGLAKRRAAPRGAGSAGGQRRPRHRLGTATQKITKQACRACRMCVGSYCLCSIQSAPDRTQVTSPIWETAVHAVVVGGVPLHCCKNIR